MTTRDRRAFILCWMACWLVGSPTLAAEDGPLALPEEPVPLAEVPARPEPLLEIGSGFLSPTKLPQGWTLPTGAVWQPSLLLWGTLRSSLQGEWGSGTDRAQWANRLDLFGQLSFTPTERLVVSIAPLHDGTRASGYRFGLDGADADLVGEFDSEIETLYFEGDLGELFPNLDRDGWPIDWGFMLGRVPVTFQDGFLLDDNITAFGIAQNSIQVPGTSNLRVSLLSAWDDVDRVGISGNGSHTKLAGAFVEFDRPETTWAVDAVYTSGDGGGDGVFLAVSAIRRIHGHWNLTARLLGSYALDGESEAVGDGLLGVFGLSMSPRGTHDVAYLNVVTTAGRFTSAARGPDRGGPLSRVGILFEAPGVGGIGSPLPNDADHVLGAALGYQKFWLGGRTQLVAEAGGRIHTSTSASDSLGVALRLQQAIGRRVVLRFDVYGVRERERGGFLGARSEIVVKF